MDQLFDAIQRLARSPAFKFFLVTFLILMLLVPFALVIGLVQEREGRARQVQGEVARVWGAAQQLSGPFLVVPYTVRVETVQGDKRIEQLQERRAVFLPGQLDVKAHTTSKVLYRSIYEVAVYTARANLEGRFLAPDMADVASDVVSVRWNDAIFVPDVGLRQTAGPSFCALVTRPPRSRRHSSRDRQLYGGTAAENGPLAPTCGQLRGGRLPPLGRGWGTVRRHQMRIRSVAADGWCGTAFAVS
jgi:hypothetical protein